MASAANIVTFASAPSGSKSPDSVTTGGGFVFVAYTNGADSTGLSGSSTIVQYDSSGNAVFTYTIAGYVDGLKYNPVTGQVWALQNQDGNSTLSLIDPLAHTVSGPLSYSPGSSTRGYDDVVFKGNQVFLSYTNPPGTSGDPTVVLLNNGDTPSGTLTTTTVLTDGTQGLNTVTGQMQVAPQTDPDSMKLAPNGDLTFVSADGGDIIDIQNPGTSAQQISFTQIQGTTGSGAGLDDAIKPSATSGTFYLSDTKDNRVISFHATGLNPNDYYASVASLGAFGAVDPTTGAFTPLISAANAPGFTFGSPHGATFVADAPATFTAITFYPGSGSVAAVGSTVTMTLTSSTGEFVGGGTPTLTLDNGGTAIFDPTKSTPTSLVFDYTVLRGQGTNSLAANSVNLNGASIVDANGQNANLSLSGLTQKGGSIKGDPHLLTFDGVAHDMQLLGDFVLTRSTAFGDNFEVQVRTAPYNNSNSVTGVSDVAVDLGGDRVIISHDDFGTLKIDGDSWTNGSYFHGLACGSITQVSSTEYKISSTRGETVTVDYHPERLDVTVSLGVLDSGNVVGLLGSDSGNAQNDFQLANGTIMHPTPGNSDQYASFADSWRVADALSLFAPPPTLGYSDGSTSGAQAPNVALFHQDISSNFAMPHNSGASQVGFPGPHFL